MYCLEYLDENVLEECSKEFKRVYPEFAYTPIGISNDKKAVIFCCNFPDGTYFFRVDQNSVSAAYPTLELADKDESYER